MGADSGLILGPSDTTLLYDVSFASKVRTWLGHSQNHLAVAGGYVVDAFDFVNLSEMPAAHPPATARWF